MSDEELVAIGKEIVRGLVAERDEARAELRQYRCDAPDDTNWSGMVQRRFAAERELQCRKDAIRPLLRAVRRWRTRAQGIESRGPLVRALIAAYDALPDDIKALAEGGDDE